jgi:hypothetical protein
MDEEDFDRVKHFVTGDAFDCKFAQEIRKLGEEAIDDDGNDCYIELCEAAVANFLGLDEQDHKVTIIIYAKNAKNR